MNLNVSQLVAEFIIVFVGVAVALAADDWREAREERSRELSYLYAIESDMRAASHELESVLADNNEFTKNLKAALAVLQSTDPVTPELVEKVNSGSDFRLAEPAVPIGTLRALLESGELSIINSNELRAILITELANIEQNLSWISRVSSNALPNLRRVNIEFEEKRIQNRLTGEPVLFDAYRESPELIVSYQTHLNLLSNIATSINAIEKSSLTIQEAVTMELMNRGS